MKILRIGVAGHALLEFDGPKATELLAKGTNQAITALRGDHEAIEIVCNLTNPALSRQGQPAHIQPKLTRFLLYIIGEGRNYHDNRYKKRIEANFNQ